MYEVDQIPASCRISFRCSSLISSTASAAYSGYLKYNHMLSYFVYFIGINFHNFAIFFGVRESLYPRNRIFSATRESLYPRNRTVEVTRAILNKNSQKMVKICMKSENLAEISLDRESL